MAQAQTVEQTDNRLKQLVSPVHYDLTVKTDLKELQFQGKVEIDVVVNEATAVIAPLQVHRAVITSSQLKTENYLEAKSIELSEKDETATLTFPSTLQAGSKARLGLTFSGPLEGSMMGYYRSAHTPDSSKPDAKEYYTLTQFEPTAARKAFPCWDEPAAKATFSFTHVYRSDTVAVANMNEVATKPSNGRIQELFAADVPDLPASAPEKGPATQPTEKGPAEKGPSEKGPSEKGPNSQASGEWKQTSYAPTPNMSTYLVAYANGKFSRLDSSYTSPLTGKTVPLAIYATRENIHQAQLTLDVTARVLPIYEKIFDIPYPLPKLDTLVAADFDAGAMENFGLITGRTSIYLYDDKASGLQAKKTTTGVQSHEIAHQWFGNMVTMTWWSNLWLNEAFATLMGECIIIQELHPEWQIHSEFINAHLKRALQLDALRSSHPIEVPCPDSTMVNQIFDAISYAKGASVLKMLANSIGEKTFLNGVSIYLKKHLYGNTWTRDLWDGISEASGLDVARVMANWTLKVGFPVVDVRETADGIKVRQNRFLSTGDVKPHEDETLWWIPLELLTVEGSKPSIDHKAILEERETVIPIQDVANATFKLNAQTAGVYRVNYTPERLAKLGEEAGKKDSAFGINDRMGLVQDAVTLAKAGYGKTSGALNLLSKLSGETENLVWTEISSAIGDVASVWWEQSDDVLDAIRAFQQDLVGPLAEKLGFEPSESEATETRELRTTIIGAALAAKEPKILAEAQRRFAVYVDQNDESLLHGDLRRSIFVHSVRNGGEKEYEKALTVFRNPPTPQHKIDAMLALANGSTKELRQHTLDLLATDEVKTQDVAYFIAGFRSWREGRRPIWEFVQANFASLEKRFKGNFSLARVVQYSFESFTTEEDAKEVEAFFSTRDINNFAQALSQGLDTIRTNAGWLQRDKDDVINWLKQQKYL